MSLKDDLYKHLLELGYQEKDGYLVVGKKYVSFELGIDTLVVYSPDRDTRMGRPSCAVEQRFCIASAG